MRFPYLLKAILLIALVSLAVIPSWAGTIPVRGGSNYGDSTGQLAGCLAKIDDFIADNTNQNNCEGFAAQTFTFGGTTYNGALFAFLEPSPGTAFGTLDIIQLGANSSLTLNLLNVNLPTGLFMCGSFGSSESVAQASDGPMTGLPCTTGASTGGFFNGAQDVTGVQVNFGASGVTFVNDTPGSIAVFTTDGNIQGTTATPEPGSLALLAVGVLALGRKFLRTNQV